MRSKYMLCAILPLVGLALAGCVTIPQSQIDGAMESARAALTAERAYARLPRCTAGASWSQAVPCSTLAGVKKVAGLSKILVADINQLERDAASGVATYTEVALALTALDNLKSAVSALEQ